MISDGSSPDPNNDTATNENDLEPGTLSGQPAKNQGGDRAKQTTFMLNERAVAVAISKLSLCSFDLILLLFHCSGANQPPQFKDKTAFG